MGKKIKIIVTVLVACLMISFAASLFVFGMYLAPVQVEPGLVTVEIKPGMNTAQISALLEKSGVVRSGKAFKWIAEYTGMSGKLQAGEYELDISLPPLDIMDRLSEGKVVLHEVTVPEGLTIRQTAEVIAAKGFSDVRSIVDAARDPALLARFGIEGKDMEGYLMPETYRFSKNANARQIVSKMVETFFDKVKSIRKKYQKDSILGFGEIVIMASIIEKETANRQEYGLISAVFHNRLKKNMLLQADPTVIFALPDFDGNIRKKDLMYDSRYNTYRYRGLPPGPIASPGVNAIAAALHPADADYLYFVATKSEGRHYFSRTLTEHNEAVRKYQLRRKK